MRTFIMLELSSKVLHKPLKKLFLYALFTFMKIRDALLKDAEQIAKNNVKLADESENLSISYEETFEGVKRIIENKSKGFYIVAEENKEIVGQIMITYEWSDWRAKDIWWLQSIYVRVEYRKREVMKALIEEVKKRALKENVSMLRLYVHEKNKDAMKAYEKVGMSKAPYIIYEMNYSAFGI